MLVCNVRNKIQYIFQKGANNTLKRLPPNPSLKLIPARGPLKKTLDKIRDSAALAWTKWLQTGQLLFYT